MYYENFKTLNLNENNLFIKTLSDRSASEFNCENGDYCLLQQAKYVSINFTWSPMVMLLAFSSFSDVLDILWCRTNIYDSNYVQTFQPNHFVPVLVNQSYETHTKIMKLQWSESAGKSKKQTNSKCGNRRLIFQKVVPSAAVINDSRMVKTHLQNMICH